MNPDNNTREADEKTGTIVAGTEAHETEGEADRAEPDIKHADEKRNGAGSETTGTIVAGREAHEVEGKVDRS